MSCLFDSLSTFIDMPSHKLRLYISNYLATNPILMDDLNAETVIMYETNTPLEQYTQSMRCNSTFGGAIEIRAFTKLFNINIRVLSTPNNKTVEFVNSESNTWKTIRWSGGHFDPVRS